MCHFFNSKKKSENFKKIKLKFYFLFIYFFFKRMVVWGGVISQLQPDLLDTPPVTVRLPIGGVVE
jgi:hypothetical protein